MMLKYSDLTLEQKQSICNGCGSKGGIINPPEFLFHASCNHHDFKYWQGCTEEDRLKADKEFYEAMKVDVSNARWFLKPYYHAWAYIYYKAVQLKGKKAFYYGPKKKYLVDLELEVQNA